MAIGEESSLGPFLVLAIGEESSLGPFLVLAIGEETITSGQDKKGKLSNTAAV